MSLENHDLELRAKLWDYVGKDSPNKVMSQADFARAIGQSDTAISCYLKDGYKAPHVLEPKIREYFRNLEEASQLGVDLDDDNTYLPTSISESVYRSIRRCHLKGRLMALVGDAGIGKTKAALKYARDFGTATYISIDPCTCSITSMLRELCDALGLSLGTKDTMWRAVKRELSGERKVVIVDEAQLLPVKSIEALRTLADKCSNVAIMLIGNPSITKKLAALSEGDSAQIHGRIRRTVERKRKDITRADIDMLYPALAGKEESLNFLFMIATRSQQSIRGATDVYSESSDNGNISFEGLVAMAKDMKKAF